MVFALTVPKPEAEAVITTDYDGVDVSWPVSTEAHAYKVAKKIGAFGFWRLKHRALSA